MERRQLRGDYICMTMMNEIVPGIAGLDCSAHLNRADGGGHLVGAASWFAFSIWQLCGRADYWRRRSHSCSPSRL